jgi:hypothetical protein
LGPSFDSQRWRPPREIPYYSLDLPLFLEEMI